VADPRDATLAAAWAERLVAFARRWPWWLVPLQRPRGWRARLWVIHAVWIGVALVFASAVIWSTLPGLWRWIVVGFLAYSATTTPFTLRKMFRAYWNAPEAARRNREVAAHGAVH
jgi:hypothetical protein